MIELVARDDDHAGLGVAGDTYNTAVYLKQLLADNRFTISYVTALGDDRFSDRIRHHMNSYGIDMACVETRTGMAPGLYAISTDDDGERSFTYWREQSAARTLFTAPCKIGLQLLSGFGLIYLSGITLAILPDDTRCRLLDFLKGFRERGGKIAFDSNYRPHLWESTEIAREVITGLWSVTDVALPSLDDEKALFGDASEAQVINRLMSLGIQYGALKRGADGSVGIKETTNVQNLETIDNIVDTTAAGDSFNAGFLSAYVQGRTLDEAIKTGHSVASVVIQAKGAIVDISKRKP